MKRNLITLCLLGVLSYYSSHAQDKLVAKFGNVTEKDFEPKLYSVDSSASAVVLADVGSSSIEGNDQSWFSLVHKHYRRVRILKKSGYDAADFEIPLYSNGNDEEKLDRIKAVTYNLENGKVVETKLDQKTGLFKNKLSKNWSITKFTFPNVKEGSIIEFEISFTSVFLSNLQPWSFQGSYPVLWSEYDLSLPEFLGYVFLTQGYKAYDINERKSRQESYRVRDAQGVSATESFSFTSAVTDYRWVIKNVPSLKEERFTSTINNHVTKLEFQLSEYRNPLTYRNLMGTWPQLTERLLESESFGSSLTKDNGWLNDISNPVLRGITDPVEKANKLYAYVRDNYTCTDHSALTMDQTLRNVVKTKSGNVAELNLLLVALLKHENIQADPVILGTRSHGYTYEIYPVLGRFNYVVCRAQIAGNDYYLDASEPHMGFNHLPLRCYNGHARVVNKVAEAVSLEAGQINEKKTTNIFIINDEKGNMVGSVQQSPGYYESYAMREAIRDKGKEAWIKDIKNDFGVDIDISNLHIDSLAKDDNEVAIAYDFDIKDDKQDIIYMNPMFGEGYKENLFKSAQRLYPVEMPYRTDETFNLQLEVPKGYVVDELPKSIIIKMNEQNDAAFEYRISQSGSNISFRSRLIFNQCFFPPDDYETLREFFNQIVKKQSEQIVFKKQK